MSYPYPSQDFSPYPSQETFDPYSSENRGMPTPYPEGMPGSSDESALYPLEDVMGAPPSPSGAGMPAYARGGRVDDSRAIPLSPLAEMLRKQGTGDDKILAHISPREATFLGRNFGGSVNPVTGLPEYDVWSKLYKGVKRHFGPVVGTIIGNTLLPGVGGVIGGGIGGSFGHPHDRQGPLKAALMSQLYLSGLNAAGAGAHALGFSSIGNGLQTLGGPNYLSSLISPVSPTASSWLGPQAQMPGFLSNMISGGNAATASTPFSMNPVEQLSSTLASKSAANPIAQLSSTLASKGATSSPSFLASLLEGAGAKGATMGQQTGSFLGQFLQPQNALSTLMVGNALRNPPPSLEKQYRAQAEAQRYLDDMLHDPERMRNRAQLERELEREKWEPLAESADDFETEQVSPEEYERTGQWFRKYKKNPQGQRVEVPYAHGGVVGYLRGERGGQEDRIPAWLSDGEYVMDANTVSALGDGNNAAGAQRLDDFRKKLLKHKGMKGFPPKTKPLEKYLH